MKTYLEEKSQNPKKLLVFFHGVGSDAADMFSLMPYFKQRFSDMNFISLDGIEDYDQAPFGFQWFSVKNRELNVLKEAITKTLPIVYNFLLEKLQDANLSLKDLILVGFSQGSMLALALSMYCKERLGAVIAFSGSVIPVDYYNNKTPICMIHGKEDEILPVDLMHQGYEYLSRLGFTVEKHQISNLKHSIDLESIDIANQFIKKYAYESFTTTRPRNI